MGWVAPSLRPAAKWEWRPEAVSWVWHPEAPYGRWSRKLRCESVSTFPSFLGPLGPTHGIHAAWLGTALRGVYPTLCVGKLAEFVRAKKGKPTKSDEFKRILTNSDEFRTNSHELGRIQTNSRRIRTNSNEFRTILSNSNESLANSDEFGRIRDEFALVPAPRADANVRRQCLQPRTQLGNPNHPDREQGPVPGGWPNPTFPLVAKPLQKLRV